MDIIGVLRDKNIRYRPNFYILFKLNTVVKIIINKQPNSF